MLDDYKPILFNTDTSFNNIELYFAHDIHFGSELHDTRKWEKFKREILSEPNRFVIFVGDYCENAVVGSKSDIYTQTHPPQVQKEWFTEQLNELKDRTIAIVPGNHENNRITKTCGLYPVYDCACINGIEDRYRQHFAFVDIGVGTNRKNRDRQVRYFGYITHRLRDNKTYNGSDFIDGIDFAAYGHDHQPKDIPRAKLVYDNKNKVVVQKNIRVIDSGSFMSYGGYGVDGGYRPNSTVIYKLILDSNNKDIKTIGYEM